MSRLAHQAEILKLARFLDVDQQEVAALLGQVEAGSIQALRDKATTAFFASDELFFKRVVAASKLLPIPALALIAESVLGPLLCARIAGQMEVKRGVGIAKRLSTEFLADVCLSLDPRRSQALIAAIPPQKIVEVALELAARDEYVTMGRFVDIITNEAVEAVLEAMQDNADLLRIAFFAENKDRLDDLIDLLPQQRLVDVIHTAASDADLWPEALGLMQHLSPEVRGRLADLAASLEEEVLTSMVLSVQTHDLWGDVLPIVIDMNEESQTRFANLPAVQQESMLSDIIKSASQYGVWPELLPLVRLMDDAGKQRSAAVAEHLDGEQLLQIAEIASEHGLWADVIELVQLMHTEQRLDTMALLGIAPARVIDSLVPAIETAQAWPIINEAWSRMGAGARDRLQAAADAQGLGDSIQPTDPAPSTRETAAAPARSAAVATVDMKPLLAQSERQTQLLDERLAAVSSGLERLSGQLQRQNQSLQDLQTQNDRNQNELRGMRGNLTALSLISGFAMLVMVSAIAVLVGKTFLT